MINIQEAEELIKKAKKETDLGKQIKLINQAKHKYYLVQTQIYITEDSLKAVAPLDGAMLKLHNEDLELLDQINKIIRKNLELLNSSNNKSLEDIEIIQIQKEDLKNKKRILY